MSIATLAEPILTGDQASGIADSDALLSKGATASRDDTAGPPRIPLDEGAPVTVAELVGIDRCESARGVRKRAERGYYGVPLAAYPVYLLAVDRLPPQVREAVLARRRMVRVEGRRQAMEEGQTAPPIYHLPAEMFNDDKLEAARQRANFVIEVGAAMQARRYHNQDECFMAIAAREWRASQPGGRGSYPALAKTWGANGWRKARASYFVWAKMWAPWRVASLPLHNFQVLCDRRGFDIPKTGAPEFWSIAGGIKARHLDMPIGDLYAAARELALQSGIPVSLFPGEEEFHACYGSSYKRFGDSMFWDEFSAAYASEERLTFEQSYNLARAAALKRSVLPASVPTLDQVKHYYRFHADKVLLRAARGGKKEIYDKLRYHCNRDWSDVHPHSMWVLDGRELDLWCRVFDPFIGPINKETGKKEGGWRPIRPKMIHMIDASAFYQVSFVLIETPTRDTAETILRAAIEQFGGAPVCLYTDNGRDFSAAFKRRIKIPMDADALRKVSDALGMRVIFALHKNPQAKLIENYHTLQGVWEKMFPSYHGHNIERHNALWNRRDRVTHLSVSERCETYQSGPSKGCLIRPELLPTMGEVAQSWVKWRDGRLNVKRKSGKIMRGKSPVEKFTGGDNMLRPLSAEEIRLAFLREYNVCTVLKGGNVGYTVPGGISATYHSSRLLELIGQTVQLRVEILPNEVAPRMYVFTQLKLRRASEDKLTWKLFPCEGIHGSVPVDTALSAMAAKPEEMRELGRKKNELQRKVSAGRNAEADLAIHLERIAELGLTTVKPGRNGGRYVLAPTPRQFAPSTQQKREDLERRASLAQERDGMDEELMRSIRGA